MLSLIETALALSDYRIPPREIQTLIDWGKAIIAHTIQLIRDVPTALDRIKPHFTLILITKGDLFDQENKLACSGLASYFKFVEVVSEKNPAVYQSILKRYNWAPREFIMAGNSLRSDVLPLIEIGSNAVHIPFHTAWVLEEAEPLKSHRVRYFELGHIGALADLLCPSSPPSAR